MLYYNCECNKGFRGDGKSCLDIDECAESTHGCHGFASCSNTEGDSICECFAGFNGDGINCTKGERLKIIRSMS